MTKVYVKIDLIKQAHAEACDKWKTILEKEFPQIFPTIFYPGNLVYYTPKKVVIYVTQNIDRENFAGIVVKSDDLKDHPILRTVNNWSKSVFLQYEGPKINVSKILKIK